MPSFHLQPGNNSKNAKIVVSGGGGGGGGGGGSPSSGEQLTSMFCVFCYNLKLALKIVFGLSNTVMSFNWGWQIIKRGDMSSHLLSLFPGEAFYVNKPSGGFCLPHPSAQESMLLILICTLQFNAFGVSQSPLPMNFKRGAIILFRLLRDLIVFINYRCTPSKKIVAGIISFFHYTFVWRCKQVIYRCTCIPNHIDYCIYSYLQASRYIVPDFQRDSVKDKKVSQKVDTCNLIPNWPSSLVKYWQDLITFLNT